MRTCATEIALSRGYANPSSRHITCAEAISIPLSTLYLCRAYKIDRTLILEGRILDYIVSVRYNHIILKVAYDQADFDRRCRDLVYISDAQLAIRRKRVWLPRAVVRVPLLHGDRH